MAKKAVCEGEVVVKDGASSAIEFYTQEFILDDAVKSLEQARSMIQAGLINERLRKEVQNYRRVRTCQVVSFESTTEKAAHSELDKLLLKATELGCMPVEALKSQRNSWAYCCSVISSLARANSSSAIRPVSSAL